MLKNVLMVTDHHVDSGIGYYSLELAREMQNIYPTVLIKPFRANHSDSYLHQEYEWIRKAPYKSLRDLRPYILPLFLRSAMWGLKSSVYHSHWFLSGLATTYLNTGPKIVTMHDVSLLHISDSNDKYLKYYKWGINRFKSLKIPLIVVSEQSREDTIKYAEYPEDLVFAVHNGINFDHFFPLQESKENSKFIIIYSGGLGKRKNVDLLLRVYQQLQFKYDFLELKIAGGHPENTPYPALAKDLNLKNITFTGFIPDNEMNKFYNSGDLLVYTSGYEGFGLAPLEAMACGVPVVSANGGALKEVSGGGADLVEYDIDHFSAAIEKVINDSTYRKKLAERGYQWVQQYSWKNTARKTSQIYEQIGEIN